MALEWVIVKDSWNGKPIGAIGFVGDEIAVITAFYDDKDWNNDGKVSKSERFLMMFSGKGRALAYVASQAYADPDILVRDPSIAKWRGDLLVKFAAGMISEGIYKVYFSQAVSKLAGAVAGSIGQNAVQSYVIKKGLQKAVKAAYNSAMRPLH